jgi:hypothetical protein
MPSPFPPEQPDCHGWAIYEAVFVLLCAIGAVGLIVWGIIHAGACG